MADQKIRFIAEWIDKGLKRGAKDAERAIDNTEKSSENLGLQFAAITAAAAGVAIAFRQIMKAAQEGAQIDVLAQSFNAMGGDLQGLRRASQGTISDFDLMNATNTLLIGTSGELRQEFIKNSSQLLKIAKAANALNPALGDTTFLYESIARGIKRSSPLILDNLGLTIKVGEANEKYAEQLGKTVDQLTAEEQQQALLNDVLRAGNDLIAEASSVNTEALDSYAQIETSWENLTNSGKELLADVLGPLVVREADLDRIRRAGIITLEEYNRLTNMPLNQRIEEIERLNTALDNQEDLLTLADKALDPYADSIADDLVPAAEDLAIALDDINTGLDSQIDKWREQIRWVDRGGETFRQAAENIKDDFTNGLINAEQAERRLMFTQLSLAQTMGEFDGLDFDQIVRELEKLGFPLEQAELFAAGIYAQLQNIDGTTVTATIVINTEGGQVEVPEGTVQVGESFSRQAGGNFVVPSWFTNDTFPVRATAGERVRVDTKSQTANDDITRLIRDRRNNRELAMMIAQELVGVLG